VTSEAGGADQPFGKTSGSNMGANVGGGGNTGVRSMPIFSSTRILAGWRLNSRLTCVDECFVRNERKNGLCKDNGTIFGLLGPAVSTVERIVANRSAEERRVRVKLEENIVLRLSRGVSEQECVGSIRGQSLEAVCWSNQSREKHHHQLRYEEYS
jgi:hypothetical protein